MGLCKETLSRTPSNTKTISAPVGNKYKYRKTRGNKVFNKQAAAWADRWGILLLALGGIPERRGADWEKVTPVDTSVAFMSLP
jgi:hypothetical protein